MQEQNEHTAWISPKASTAEIFTAALKAADPYQAVLKHVSIDNGVLRADGEAYDLAKFDKIVVVGAGKGTAAMARAAEDLLGERLDRGLIIVKYGHTGTLKKIVQREAGHPIPDEAGLKATDEIRELLSHSDEKTLVICLFSGGASSLLVSPVEGVSLDDKRAVTDILLKAGANIVELNAMRKHLSAVKGGRLAEIAHPATVLSLILSDVIGDPLDVIASGPTAPDPTTFHDALRVVHQFGLEKKIPNSVFSLLHMGKAGVLPDTPKPGAEIFSRVRHIIVGSNAQSITAASVQAQELGYVTEVISTELRGEAREAARELASRALAAQSGMKPGDSPRCLLAGGETTVTVAGTGKGGRNQELALAFSLEVAGRKGVSHLSAGTDGTDGPTDAAGAIVDGDTVGLANKHGMDPAAFLANNDSYTFFNKLDSLTGEKNHLITGPTGTNVMDIQIVIVEEVHQT